MKTFASGTLVKTS